VFYSAYNHFISSYNNPAAVNAEITAPYDVDNNISKGTC
jgi:hypothetical protein